MHDRGEITVEEAADALKVSKGTIYRLIASGVLPATQYCAGAPWIIQRKDAERPEIKREADARRLRRPLSGDPRQQSLEFQ